MMHWQVRYYLGQLPLHVVTSDDASVADLPEHGVIDVTITDPNGISMTLVGADSYYLIPGTTRFGLFNEDGSSQHFIWTKADGFDLTEPPHEIPHRLFGVLMPDDEAREIGLRS